MLIQHRTVCPYCAKPLLIGLRADTVDAKAIATAICDNCKEAVALDYEVTTTVRVDLGRINWDRKDPKGADHEPILPGMNR